MSESPWDGDGGEFRNHLGPDMRPKDNPAELLRHCLELVEQNSFADTTATRNQCCPPRIAWTFGQGQLERVELNIASADDRR